MKLSSIAALTAGFAGALALAAFPAAAVPIPTGSNLDFTSGVASIGSANVYNGTGVDFYTMGLPSVGTDGTINLNNTTGGQFSIAFNAFTCPAASAGGCGTIKDLQNYTPNSHTLTNPALPVFNFLTITQGGKTMSFDLTSFTNTEIQPVTGQLGTLILSGLGIIHLTGFDPTIATMTITAQGDGATSFSGTVIAQGVVPEPASLAVLGVGLAGLISARRKSTRPVSGHS